MSRVIVAGSHDAGIPKHVVWSAIINSRFIVTEVGFGGAREVDTYGKQWAELHRVPVEPFYPEWSTYGKAAGPMRNHAMSEWGDSLVLCWNGISHGSADMRRKMQRFKKPIYEVVWRDGKILSEGHLELNGSRL